MPRIAHTTRRPARRGFTITELMISVVLVLLLTLAVGLIFRTTSETINKGSATGEAVRNLDGIRTALAIDMTGTDTIDYDQFTDTGGILPNSEQVAIMIASSATVTFGDQADFDSDARSNFSTNATPNNWIADARTIDLNGDGVENGGEATVLPILGLQGRRMFRTDQITFGASGEFASQTGTAAAGFSSQVQSRNALVYYGHLRVFTNNYSDLTLSRGYGNLGVPFSGSGDENVNNRFANQFILGRTALGFIEPNGVVPATPGVEPYEREYIVASDGTPIPFFRANWNTPNDLADHTVSPSGGPTTNTNSDGSSILPFYYSGFIRTDNEVFGNIAWIYDPTSGAVEPFSELDYSYHNVYLGRVDVLGTSAAEMRERLSFVVETDPAISNRSNPDVAMPFRGGSSNQDQYSRLPRNGENSNSGEAWWENWMWTETSRFWINPFGQQPFDAGKMGQRHHLLAPGVRQFMVEYAGDYFTQDASGLITATGPDGQIDYLIDSYGRRVIRFYGFPRDADGDGDIELRQGGATTGPYTSPDVLPLKDMAVSGGAPVVFPHEKIVPRTGSLGATAPVPQTLSYATSGTGTTIPAAGARYVCAWSPDELEGNFPAPFDFPLGPKLLRFVVEAVDSGGELEAPQRAEYVFRVPD